MLKQGLVEQGFKMEFRREAPSCQGSSNTEAQRSESGDKLATGYNSRKEHSGVMRFNK